uniref:Uncharacterized protein n=1 Tax=Zea mays TaxID=4577 RepID=A0A804MM61_MAIZE
MSHDLSPRIHHYSVLFFLNLSCPLYPPRRRRHAPAGAPLDTAKPLSPRPGAPSHSRAPSLECRRTPVPLPRSAAPPSEARSLGAQPHAASEHSPLIGMPHVTITSLLGAQHGAAAPVPMSWPATVASERPAQPSAQPSCFPAKRFSLQVFGIIRRKY